MRIVTHYFCSTDRKYQLNIIGHVGPRSMDHRQGLLCLIPTVEPQVHGPAPPCSRAPRLGHLAFSISVVNSLGGNFVGGVPWIVSPAARHPRSALRSGVTVPSCGLKAGK